MKWGIQLKYWREVSTRGVNNVALIGFLHFIAFFPVQKGKGSVKMMEGVQESRLPL